MLVTGGPPWRAMLERTLSLLGAKLTQGQNMPFWSPARIKLVMGGERSGKSYTGALYLVSHHLLGELYWLVGLDYETCRPEFTYISDFLEKLGNIQELFFPREGPCVLITKTGQRIETRSTQDPRKVAGRAPDGILGCEVALWTYETFLRVRGRLAEKRAWAWFSGSFESSLGWCPELWQRWQVYPNPDAAASFSVPTWSNTFIFPGGEDDAEIERLRVLFPSDRFSERFGGVPVPPSGRVYREFGVLEHVAADAAYTPGTDVYLGVDPGYSGAYAVLAAQLQGEQVYVIDEVYAQRITHEEAIHLCQTRPWWKDVIGGAIDIAGRQHHQQASAVEIWRDKTSLLLDSNYIPVEDGIDRVQTFLRPDPLLRQPKLRVSPRCRGLIAEMGCGPSPVAGGGMYRYKTDAAGNVLSERPFPQDNHACTALAYLLVALFGFARPISSAGPMTYLEMMGGTREATSITDYAEGVA